MNAPPPRPARDLARALAAALSLGLPDPDYITIHVRLGRSPGEVGFQFNDRNGQEPLAALRAWADRFGVTVDVSAGAGRIWHQFDFTHAGTRYHAYAEIPAGAPTIGANQ